MSKIQKRHNGAVSIFVVIFTMLLITVVTMSFARLMIREQQRASDNDLSQSAYDAALAGVEDAKRALAVYDGSVDLEQCNGIAEVLGGDSSDEVQVGDAEMNQAYTCVKVYTETEDYQGEIGADQTRLVPLEATGSFDQVIVEWYSRDDLGLASGLPSGSSTSVTLPASTGTESQLINTWPVDQPPVLEVGLIQTSNQFRLQDFDQSSAGHSNTNTLFLYPRQLASSPDLTFMADRREPYSRNGLTDVRCVPSLESAIYSCRAAIDLPEPIGGSAGERQNTYLKLVPRYTGTHFRVSLQRSGVAVNFDGVQPRVDSTGRASDLFRRVSARVETNSNAIYPDAAIETSYDLCKTFMVTDRSGDYDSGLCDPSQP